MTRPYSWLEGDRGYPYADLRVFRPLAGWGPAELIAPGVPVIVRRGLDEDDAVLRAFLDQPVVQYCHAADLRSGLAPLERVAAVVNTNSDVRWCSLEEISRSNFATRNEGTVLELLPSSHRIHVTPTDGVTAVRVVPPELLSDVPYEVRSATGGQTFERRTGIAEFPVHTGTAGRETLEVTFEPAAVVDPVQIGRPERSGVAVFTRLTSEIRDRAQPLIRRPRKS